MKIFTLALLLLLTSCQAPLCTWSFESGVVGETDDRAVCDPRLQKPRPSYAVFTLILPLVRYQFAVPRKNGVAPVAGDTIRLEDTRITVVGAAGDCCGAWNGTIHVNALDDFNWDLTIDAQCLTSSSLTFAGSLYGHF
jgi:hypothetical protein